jgi:hypothetical protein
MSNGLNIFHSTGSLTFSTDDVTWNQVDFFYVAGGGSASNNYPVLSGRTTLTVQMFINPPPTDRRAIAHTVSVNGTNVSVSGGTEAEYILVLMK